MKNFWKKWCLHGDSRLCPGSKILNQSKCLGLCVPAENSGTFSLGKWAEFIFKKRWAEAPQRMVQHPRLKELGRGHRNLEGELWFSFMVPTSSL